MKPLFQVKVKVKRCSYLTRCEHHPWVCSTSGCIHCCICCIRIVLSCSYCSRLNYSWSIIFCYRNKAASHLCCCILFSCEEQVHHHRGSNKAPISYHKGFGLGFLISILTRVFPTMICVRSVLLNYFLLLPSDFTLIHPQEAFFLKIANWTERLL